MPAPTKLIFLPGAGGSPYFWRSRDSRGPAMILEIAILDVIPGRAAAFDSASGREG